MAYQCPICKTRFRQHSQLRNHIKRDHKYCPACGRLNSIEHVKHECLEAIEAKREFREMVESVQKRKLTADDIKDLTQATLNDLREQQVAEILNAKIPPLR